MAPKNKKGLLMSGVRNRKIAFNYFGGKFTHADWIIKHLPASKSYVEVFAGSAVILLNRKPARIETLNDINKVITNFFTVLRDNPDELINKIFLSPYSLDEYRNCFQNINDGDNIERARRFFVVVNQSFNGSYSRQTGWKISTKETRANTSEAISRWISKVPNLLAIVERLRRVQISNYDFRLMFEKFDGPETLFYCDPPYMHDTRCNNNEYEFEMSENDHLDLIQLFKNAKGKVALSGYDNDLYNSSLGGYYKTIAKEKRITLFGSKRQEILWTNYDPNHINKNLFNQA
jgi:DNA adenine methylase